MKSFLSIILDSLLRPEFYRINVLDLADLLGFEFEVINYLTVKENPFRYLLKEWHERDGKFATLNCLLMKVKELGRPDIEELVEEAIKGLWFVDSPVLNKCHPSSTKY